MNAYIFTGRFIIAKRHHSDLRIWVFSRWKKSCFHHSAPQKPPTYRSTARRNRTPDKDWVRRRELLFTANSA